MNIKKSEKCDILVERDSIKATFQIPVYSGGTYACFFLDTDDFKEMSHAIT